MRDNKYTALSRRVEATEAKVKVVQSRLKPKPTRPALRISNSEVIPRRAFVSPVFDSKTVLTDSTWRYVEIFLKKHKAYEALFYWEQAYNFFKATESLSLVSSPLTTYYTFLNATKSLLVYKNIGFDDKHGVSGKKVDGHHNLQNEKVFLKPKGIVSSLSIYLKEPIPARGVEYDLKHILYNLEFIHRAYHLTYGGSELFIPIVNPRFVHDKSRKKGWFEAQLEAEHSSRATVTKLIGFGLDNKYDNSFCYTIRRNKDFDWEAPRNKPTGRSLNSLSRYHLKIRKQLRYIYSPNNIWYIKRKDLRNVIIDRSTLPLTFIAMHRLSELSRYHPQMLKNHLEQKASWLLSEFITKSMVQFIDQISSEMTGMDFRMTGFRA